MSLKIAFLAGDGIGPEVLAPARDALLAAGLDAEFVEGEVGWSCWERYGNALPDETLRILKETRCALFGAITSKPGVAGYRSPILRMRQDFDLYINLRPVKAFRGNPKNLRDDIDFVIFRENTEDLYAGIEFQYSAIQNLKSKIGVEALPEDAVLSLRLTTPAGCRRIVRAAFGHAAREGRKRVTAVHKANVILRGDGLFLRAAREAAGDYPRIRFDDMIVDAAALNLIRAPQEFDVIVTTNLFGDILSDEAAGLVGGLGFAPSANIGDSYAVFEPAHGSAPDIAGQGIANPVAAILSGAMLARWAGKGDVASAVERAVTDVVAEGRVRTADMGGSASTREMGEAIITRLK